MNRALKDHTKRDRRDVYLVGQAFQPDVRLESLTYPGATACTSLLRNAGSGVSHSSRDRVSL